LFRPLFIALSSGLFAQLLKILFHLIKHKKFSFRPFAKTGGMPSSHTSTVTSLSVAIGISEGFNSVLFDICTVFSLIIMYDAAGLRRSVGKQAVVLNKILEDIELRKHIGDTRIKELLGHTPLEVIMGAILGMVWAFFWYFHKG